MSRVTAAPATSMDTLLGNVTAVCLCGRRRTVPGVTVSRAWQILDEEGWGTGPKGKRVCPDYPACAALAAQAVDQSPPTPLPVPCRFGCRSPAVRIVHFPTGCICWPDPVQALCAQHANKGLQNNHGVLIARWDDRSSRWTS